MLLFRVNVLEPKLAFVSPYLTNHQEMATVRPGLPNTRQSFIYIYTYTICVYTICVYYTYIYIYLSICLSVCLSTIYLSIYLSIWTVVPRSKVWDRELVPIWADPGLKPLDDPNLAPGSNHFKRLTATGRLSRSKISENVKNRGTPKSMALSLKREPIFLNQ